MRLIFVTRKLDRQDPRTGFVFSWIAKLASALDGLDVICLEKGDAAGLPENTRVFSMGKEAGKSRIKELGNYWRILRQILPASSGIFIHMHPVYAIAAWPWAKIFRKKMILWYVHKSVDLKLKVAHALVDEVLTASKASFRLLSRKVKIVGHGIDLEKFKSNALQPPLHLRGGGVMRFRIVSVGRISPVKDYETLIKAAQILKNQGVTDFKLNIYGSAELPAEKSYLDSLLQFIESAELDDLIDYQGPIAYDYVDEVHEEADLFVSSSQTGSLDKAVLEAAATGVIVLTSNQAFEEPLRRFSPALIFKRDHPEDLANRILEIKSWPPEKKTLMRETMRLWVETEHNLDNLISKIIKEFAP